MANLTRRQKGFSLIELVAAIVILGVISAATSQFIVFGSQIYVDAARQQTILSASRFVVDRLSRELRTSIPNSVRTYANGACIQFVPIKASGAYRTDVGAETAPIAPADNDQIDVVSWSGSYDAGDRFYIYAASEDEIYNSSTQYGVINLVTASPSIPDLNIEFVNVNQSFTNGSPNERYYTADSSVYFCLSAGSMYRYETPGVDNTLHSAAEIADDGVLMAEYLTNGAGEPAFTYELATLQRNSVVNLYLEFSAIEGENMFFNQEVHIPNVP